MVIIRGFWGNWWNPLHLLIMLITRSRVVHCDVEMSFIDTKGKTHAWRAESSMKTGVVPCQSTLEPSKIFVFQEKQFVNFTYVWDTPYDYASCLSYIWPWVRQSESRMNCVEVCLWAMRRAGMPTPKHLPTPGGLMRWCKKIQKEKP